MKRKYIMVPYDLYKNMMREPVEDLDQSEHKMHEILRDKHLDDSTKNLLYNQELLNYLKQRKEMLERPIKVENVEHDNFRYNQYAPRVLASGPHPGPLPFDRPIPPPPPPPSPPRRRRRRPSPMLHASDSDLSPPRPTGRRRSRSPLVHRAPPPRVPTPPPAAAPPGPARAARANVRRRRGDLDRLERRIETMSQQIYDTMLTRRNDFGITENGQVVNPGTTRAMRNSQYEDAKQIVKRYLGSLQTDPNIPGYHALRRRLLADNAVNGRLQTFLNELQAMGRGMGGRGEKTDRTLVKTGNSRTFVFTPRGRVDYKLELWN